ncbi:MAG: hypothetical protein MAGBODY4_00563 [Candidatus Marinimicrobia bacterium]|nr:hypothetical protein [Candidatus Neomarinimicrobiota bacterium]
MVKKNTAVHDVAHILQRRFLLFYGYDIKNSEALWIEVNISYIC